MIHRRFNLRKLLTVISALGVSVTSLAQERPSQSVGDSPQIANTPADLQAAIKRDYPTVRALLLARGDCVFWTYYGAEPDRETLLRTHSITKSVLSVLVGIAIDRGYLQLIKGCWIYSLRRTTRISTQEPARSPFETC
jgi:CubicO group peptidase (beta-lactamase class C family)